MRDFLTKNHCGERTDESPRNPKCPVMSSEKYTALLNKECLAFCQKLNLGFNAHPTLRWYCNVPISANVLSNKMKSLSIGDKFSNNYTNHYLRATCITALNQSGLLLLLLFFIIIIALDNAPYKMLHKLKSACFIRKNQL